MDVFNSNAFSATTLTGNVQKMDYRPQLLGSLNLFDPVPSRTRDIFVDRRDGTLSLIPASASGEPPAQLAGDTRDAVNLRTVRLAKSTSQINAAELQGIRAFGSETELMAVESEFNRRLARVNEDMELTHEHHRLGALQGKLLDADGSTVLYNYYTQFNESEASAVSFELDVATTNVRGLCQDITRAMARSARGSFTPQTQVHALAGDDFYDALINHPNVINTYTNWAAAADLRQNMAFQAFSFGGITFHNYRGTDDNSTVAIPTAECKFFPVGARDMFEVAFSPLETLDFVNTPGQRVYAMTVRDLQRNMWVQGEVYSYPLYLCKQPRVLRKATLT
jgi:hypothetical protein